MENEIPESAPPAVAAYFQSAESPADANCFAEDAVVYDEGRNHSGRAEILAWMKDTSRRYRPKYRPVRWTTDSGECRLIASVSGDFPQSPVELDFEFRLAGDTITRLEIR